MRTAGLCSALIAVFLAAASISPGQIPKGEIGSAMPKGVEHINRDPFRQDDWYRDYYVKAREQRIDSIDYGAVAGPDPVPFFHGEAISRMAFSPDGSFLASGAYSGGIKVWNSKTGETVAKLDGHRNWISALAFSADSKQLISGSGDSSIRVWDVEKSNEEARLAPLRDTPLEIVVHPTDKAVYWRGSMTAVGEWNLETGDERSFFPQEQLTRSLTGSNEGSPRIGRGAQRGSTMAF
jgi:WD40 repeat protein